MLLRRITQHVKDQNWFAVFLDFIIVVVGVFIGIQVSNWNELQTNNGRLSTTLERLDDEVAQNISIADSILKHYDDGKETMILARESLNDCSYSPEGQAALEQLMFDLVGDTQPNFVTVVQDQLARQDHYQSLLSEKFQKSLAQYIAKISEEHEQLSSHYEQMWEHHINYHPKVNAFFSGEPGSSLKYEGWGFKLDVPFEEVCNDSSFRNRFINTIGFYTSINQRLLDFKVESNQFAEILDHELKSR